MALRNIILSDNEIIRKKSKAVSQFDAPLWQLLDDMYDTMVQNNGCGIAAVQVGVLKRVVIVEANGLKLELINPEIIAKKGKQVGMEGCLSVKNTNGKVERPYEITVKAFDRYGNAMTLTVCDFTAVAVCHELDHLDGILFIDKIVE
ncbi:MAG: peptide deformylase [Clostridiales bacterium]|nr:peptide deformylase [Clostridiales bacterium]